MNPTCCNQLMADDGARPHPRYLDIILEWLVCKQCGKSVVLPADKDSEAKMKAPGIIFYPIWGNQ